MSEDTPNIDDVELHKRESLKEFLRSGGTASELAEAGAEVKDIMASVYEITKEDDGE